MRVKKAISVVALLTLAGWAQSAAAAVVFTDNFNSYAYQLNWDASGKLDRSGSRQR